MEMFGDSYAIAEPDLDEHISIEGLLAGRRSGESQKAFERWLVARMLKNTNVGEHEIAA